MEAENLILPDFLIIGAQKSGTSWLQKMLSEHPSIYMPSTEIHYFDKGYNFRKGVKWYASFFNDATDKQLIGEKTPDYFWPNGEGVEGHLSEVHKNIYELLPEVKLIITLRDPVMRAVSAVKHIIRSGRISPKHSIDSLLIEDKAELISGHGVLEYGCYFEHLSAYLEFFDRSQILILIFEEDIKQNPRQGLIKIYDFLNISHFTPAYQLEKKINAHQTILFELYTKYYIPQLYPVSRFLGYVFPKELEPPKQDTLLQLYDYYSDGNKQLFDYLNRDIPISWKIEA